MNGIFAMIMLKELQAKDSFGNEDLAKYIFPSQERWSFSRRAGAKWLPLFGSWHFHRGMMEMDWGYLDCVVRI